jgi:drug/metabolite transporter (DMT)-like permease
MAVALALAASLMWGVGDYLGGLASRRNALVTVILAGQAAGLAALLVVAALRGIETSPRGTLAGVGAGLLSAVAITAFYRALTIGTMSIAAPVLSTSAAVPVVVSVAGGDLPSPAQSAGIAAALIGVVLASREPAHGHPDPAAQRQSFLLALVATVAIGLQLVLLSTAADTDPLLGVTASRMTSVLVFAGVALAVRPPVRREALPGLAGIGLLDTAANVCYAAATTAGLLSVVAVLSSLYPVVTVGLAHRHLGERLTRPQRVGVALALGGAALISAG